MSLFPDIAPLTNEIKVFSSQLQELNANSLQTHQLLTHQNQLLTEILTEIRNSKRISIVENKLTQK